MKLTLVILILLAIDAPAQPLATPTPNARLYVRTGTLRKKVDTHWKGDDGSYQKDLTREITLDVSITAVSRGQFPAEVQWYVVGKPVINGGARCVVALGKSPVVIDPVSGVKTQVTSGPIKSEDDRYNMWNQRQTSGHRIEGWFVRLTTADGTLLDRTASVPELVPWGDTNCQPGMKAVDDDPNLSTTRIGTTSSQDAQKK